MGSEDQYEYWSISDIGCVGRSASPGRVEANQFKLPTGSKMGAKWRLSSDLACRERESWFLLWRQGSCRERTKERGMKAGTFICYVTTFNACMSQSLQSYLWKKRLHIWSWKLLISICDSNSSPMSAPESTVAIWQWTQTWAFRGWINQVDLTPKHIYSLLCYLTFSFTCHICLSLSLLSFHSPDCMFWRPAKVTDA